MKNKGWTLLTYLVQVAVNTASDNAILIKILNLKEVLLFIIYIIQATL